MIVLDTHVLIWLMQDDARLGPAARQVIVDAASIDPILVPAICAWEVAHLTRRGKVQLPTDAVRWMRNALDVKGMRLAPLDLSIAVDSVEMVWDHGDPADRMIVATARYWSAVLLTVDRAILNYAAQGHLQVLDASR